MAPARALGDEHEVMREPAALVIRRAKTSWLKNIEVADILTNHKDYELPVSTEPPLKPLGGTLYLFDKKQERYFRRDGHQWRKKANGKTVRETHEKLKVENKDMLNCYYTHSEELDALQRRCYWLLDQDDGIVLVHYLTGNLSKSRHAPGAPSTLGPSQVRPMVVTETTTATPFTGPHTVRLQAQSSHVHGNKRISEMEHSNSPASGGVRPEECLPHRGQFRTGSLPGCNTDATRELFHYGQSLQAKKLTGEVIQPTAVHATAFSNTPLFMAIDASQSMQRLQELATQHRAMMRGEGPPSTPATAKSQADSQVQAEKERAEEVKEWVPQTIDTPFLDQATDSLGRVASDPATASASGEGEEPQTKRRRKLEAGEELSHEEVIKCFLDSNRELLSQFKESNAVLLQHLQYQRQADDSFRRELMEMERERAKNERETLAMIASALLGSSRLPRADPVQEAASFLRYNPSSSSSFPFGALAQSMMMNGSWPLPPARDDTR